MKGAETAASFASAPDGQSSPEKLKEKPSMKRQESRGLSRFQTLCLTSAVWVLAANLVGCAVGSRAPTVLSPAPVVQVADGARAVSGIDAIIYSDLSKAQMLEKLGAYVSLMDTREDLKRKVGVAPDECLGSGPGVMDCGVGGSGLRLVFDPDGRLRVIRRNARSIQGTKYPEISISESQLEWRGYRRWYPR